MITIKKNEHQIKTDQQLLLEIKNGKKKSFDELLINISNYLMPSLISIKKQ